MLKNLSSGWEETLFFQVNNTKKATWGKVILRREVTKSELDNKNAKEEKTPKQSKLWRHLQKFIGKSSYLWGWGDDTKLKCCTNAGKWVSIIENTPHKALKENYFEEEYNIILSQVHSRVNISDKNSLEKEKLKNEASTIEQN